MAEGATGSAGGRLGRGVLQARRRIEAARGYLVLEMYEHALRELAAVRDASLHHFEIHQLRGEALRGLGRWSEAIVSCTRALAERPRSLPVLMAAADCYRALGKIDRAIATLEEANRLFPNEPAVLFLLARLSVTSGDAPAALQWLDEASQICPEVALYAEDDLDFAALKTHPHFRRLVELAVSRDG